MQFAAFFRNLNHGRSGSPTKNQLVSAFVAAGAKEADSFLSHGNVVFSAPGIREATAVAQAARDQLRLVCGLDEPVFTRSIKQLTALVASEPFATAPTDGIYERCVSFLPAGVNNMPALPIVTLRRNVEVFQFLPGAAFSVSRKIGASPGSPNALLERLLSTQATTRNWNTVIRLVRKHG